MSNSCNKVENNILGEIPNPPETLKGLLEEYQDFWSSVFTREYKPCNENPYGTTPIYMPRLSKDEKEQVEKLTRRIHSLPEWKEYTQQCKRWAIMM